MVCMYINTPVCTYVHNVDMYVPYVLYVRTYIIIEALLRGPSPFKYVCMYIHTYVYSECMYWCLLSNTSLVAGTTPSTMHLTFPT